VGRGTHRRERHVGARFEGLAHLVVGLGVGGDRPPEDWQPAAPSEARARNAATRAARAVDGIDMRGADGGPGVAVKTL
jgi:hypothetical protein